LVAFNHIQVTAALFNHWNKAKEEEVAAAIAAALGRPRLTQHLWLYPRNNRTPEPYYADICRNQE